MFRYHLLGLLHHGESVHGYALIKEYNHRTGRRVPSGNAYRELRRLEEVGMVRSSSKSQDGSEEGLMRVSYEITAKGIRAFDQWFLSVPYPSIAEEKELAGRLIFFGDVEPTKADGIIAHWEQGLLETRKKLEQKALRNASGKDNRSGRLLLQRRREILSAELRFIEHVKEEYGLKGETPPLPSAEPSRRAAAHRWK